MWCNGNTRDSKPLDPGSIPGIPAKDCGAKWKAAGFSPQCERVRFPYSSLFLMSDSLMELRRVNRE